MIQVCRLINGVAKCACPINYKRDPSTKSCTVINECNFPQLIDCHPSAECIDQPNSYTCRCLKGFKDVSPPNKPGRICQACKCIFCCELETRAFSIIDILDINECQFPHLNDCHQNAECIDKEDGYECKCYQGFKDGSPDRPGRLCKQMINECAKSSLNRQVFSI